MDPQSEQDQDEAATPAPEPAVGVGEVEAQAEAGADTAALQEPADAPVEAPAGAGEPESGTPVMTLVPAPPADPDAARHRRNVIEAALLAAGRTLTTGELLQLFDVTARPSTAELAAALQELVTGYADRGIELRETAAGWRIQVRRELSIEISRLWPERPQKYSRALLETLALIAYRQPLTRAEIEAVRGVAVNPNIVRTLLERGWIRVVGHRDLPGHPELLGTTREFLDYFNLRSLEELPPLAELKLLSEIEPQLELAPAPLALTAQGEGVPQTDAEADADADADANADIDEPADADAPAETDAPGDEGVTPDEEARDDAEAS